MYYNLPSKKLWRTLLAVNWHDHRKVEFRVPSWSSDSIVVLMRIIPKEVRESILNGNTYFYAKCNIGADYVEELFLCDWEIPQDKES